MGIQVVGQGRVVGAPVEVLTDAGRITALLLRDDDDRETPEYEVLCREPRLAKRVLDEVGSGDALLVFGVLQLKRLQGPTADDPCAAIVSIEAFSIAPGLDAHL
jgi:hypothetical protein